MRLKGTKYEKVDKLPNNALTVNEYAEVHGMGSAAYVTIKYDRFKQGYKNKAGNILFGEKTSYKIVCWKGINFCVTDN